MRKSLSSSTSSSVGKQMMQLISANPSGAEFVLQNDSGTRGKDYTYLTHQEISCCADASSDAAFASFWGQLAKHYASNLNIVFGLENEPHAQTAAHGLPAAEAAIASGSHDPARNHAFEVHQCLDADASGTSATIADSDVDIGVERLQAVTQWAQQIGNKLFLGEVGVGPDVTSTTALANILSYMQQNAGAW